MLFSSPTGQSAACGNRQGVGLNQTCAGLSPVREVTGGLARVQCKLANVRSPSIIRVGVPRQGAGEDHFGAVNE